MKPLRIVVWGLGRHAVNKIVPAIAETEGLMLAGVCSRNAATVSRCVEQWHCRGWTDSDVMLSDAAVDVVYVSTPIGLHGAHGKRVLAAQKHLWSEKPLTSQLETTHELIDASRRQDLAVCEALMYLHHPQVAYLGDCIEKGVFGQMIVSIGCRFGIPPLDHPGFRSEPALGGGALFDVGCYPVSALHALFPNQDPQVVAARIGFRSGSAVDTDGDALLVLSSGATAHLEWRINCAYRNEISIWGTTASVVTDRIFSKAATYVPTFRFQDAHGVETVETGVAADHFVAMLRSFTATTLSSVARESERGRIVLRANTLEQIQRRARPATVNSAN